jgi:hypothetical protein
MGMGRAADSAHATDREVVGQAEKKRRLGPDTSGRDGIPRQRLK